MLLPSIINSNPHRHHRDHATRHASISPRCDPQRRSRHSTDLTTLVAFYERERERDVREGERTEDERMGWVFCERKRECTTPERVGVRVRWRGERKNY